MTTPIRPGRILADDELLPAVRTAIARVNRDRDGYRKTDLQLAEEFAEDALALAVAAANLLGWMDHNDVDPGDPPSCGCGGYHWSCPGPDADDADEEEDDVEVCGQCCTETEGLADVQGTLLCEACIAYNVSRCM